MPPPGVTRANALRFGGKPYLVNYNGGVAVVAFRDNLIRYARFFANRRNDDKAVLRAVRHRLYNRVYELVASLATLAKIEKPARMKSIGHVVRIGKRFEFFHILKIFNISGLVLSLPDVTNIANVFPICKFFDHFFAKICIPIIYRGLVDRRPGGPVYNRSNPGPRAAGGPLRIVLKVGFSCNVLIHRKYKKIL